MSKVLIYALATTCLALLCVFFIAQFYNSDIRDMISLEYRNQTNTILKDIFCNYDMRVTKEILALNPRSPDAAIKLFSVLKRPIQTGCNYLRRIGIGHPMANGIIWDGHKFVCLDDFPRDEPCLVYSFGLSREISFETMLERRGCQIYGYDHTVNLRQRNTANFHTFQFGISNASNARKSDKFKHFKQILSENGHLNASINYLKMDIEGSEREVLPEMIKNNLLKNVQQVAMEVHRYDRYSETFVSIFQDLYRLGFRVISFEPNFASLPKLRTVVWPLFEVVLRKMPVCSSFEGL